MNFQNAFVAVAALSIFSAGAAVTSEIPLLPGERWWGGGGADGQNQPYPDFPRSHPISTFPKRITDKTGANADRFAGYCLRKTGKFV